jgi:Xaa-Pro aminopeptidase/Xaa-Pro dipeptidase
MATARLSRPEGERRHAAIREKLDAGKFDAYVVFDPLNFVYATNFLLDVEPWERPVAAIFPREGAPSLILNELSTNHYTLAVERGTCWVPDAEIYVEHPVLVDRKFTRPEWDRLLAEVLGKHGFVHGRVAVDGLSRISPSIRALMPDVTFYAQPELIRDLRLVKSDAELDILRAGGKLTTWAMGELKSLLAPGEFIYEISLETAKRLGRRTAETYPDEAIQVEVSADTGVDTACPHSPGGNAGRQIAKGDSIIANVLVRINGYWTEDERMFLMGEPSPDQLHYLTAMADAQQAAIAAMTEANRIVDIDAAALAVHEKAGTSKYLFARTGHGIGLGGHEYPDDMAYNYRPLEAGMVFSSEPAVFVRGLGGFRHSDTVIVGTERPECVTTFSQELADLVISA